MVDKRKGEVVNFSSAVHLPLSEALEKHLKKELEEAKKKEIKAEYKSKEIEAIYQESLQYDGDENSAEAIAFLNKHKGKFTEEELETWHPRNLEESKKKEKEDGET